MPFTFGPVPSRRLGRSLGVDLVPFKTCTYDCIYCQLGRTTCKTMHRQEYVPLDEVLAELKEKLATKPDYITLSGSGEPTLFSRLDELIGGIRSMTDIPVAVLTNGSLLWQGEVRRQLMDAHLVLPSLDAGTAGMFQAINRPHEDIAFDRMLDGLISFREEYYGEYWLEVFLLAGHNVIDSELNRIIECVRKVSPGRVQLNTAVRPPAEEYAAMVDSRRMRELACRFDPVAEVIADYRGTHSLSEFCTGTSTILQTILRRPCSLADLSEGLGLHPNQILKHIEELDREGLLEKRWTRGRLFYSGRHPGNENSRLET